MTERRQVFVWGSVQGVGFRPFAYALAEEMGIRGRVLNSPEGAELEVEGRSELLDQYLDRLARELPEPGCVGGMEAVKLPPLGLKGFRIDSSTGAGSKTAGVLPDMAPCPKCLAELRQMSDRRHRYPFINCTHCGPRYSIIRRIPYDREATTMAGFHMCPECQSEYDDPSSRRFHAQPNACPVCGPVLELWDPDGVDVAKGDHALLLAEEAIRHGRIVALKGVGGFHLIVDASQDKAVLELRRRKRREAKPLAVMAGSLAVAEELAWLSDEERALLSSAAAPIVIAQSKHALAPSIAPENPNIGLMLPSSPLHTLLMDDLGFPVVCTSGNLTDEPLCIDEREAIERLRGIADLFLVHNRPIVRPIDDSVCRMLGEGAAVLRRARGYAPLAISLPGARPGMAAFGAHLKGSAALSSEGSAIVGQHVGDLDNALARRRLEEEIRDLAALHESPLNLAVHDLHPDYASTLLAERSGLPGHAVQHHLAHVCALAAEHAIAGPLFCASWDGTGLGLDGAIWGGEFILLEGSRARRLGRLRSFDLPGGDSAARQGFRSALGALYSAFGPAEAEQASGIHPQGRSVVSLLRSGMARPSTTSAGRLFDAAAALAGGIMESRFEGDAAMRWEGLADPNETGAYPMLLDGFPDPFVLDWSPLLLALMRDDSPPPVKSARFHRGLANGIVLAAMHAGVRQVGLTGGCFQNRLLSRLACEGLRKHGFEVFEHRRIPPNDGGIAFGQLAAAVKGIRYSLD